MLLVRHTDERFGFTQRLFAIFSALVLLQVFLPSLSASAANAGVGDGATVSYTENAAAVLAGAGLTVTGGPFDGKYIEFAIGSQAASDVLSLQKVQTPVIDDGVVSVVGNQIYVGDNTTAKPFASIDETKNGTNGQPLRINFTSAFGNSGFENATVGAITVDDGNTSPPSISTRLAGWTIVGLGNQNHFINLGVTSLGGFVSDDSNNTYPANTTNRDNNIPDSATFSAEITTSVKNEGEKSLRLFSTMGTKVGCDVVHGPAAVSEPFAAAQGDVISFDWSAADGGDDYDAYGYIVNTTTGAQTEVIDSNGISQPWTTTSANIPVTGNYRFVFVNGTHDRTCGKVAGGSLYIDNIRVVGTLATAANVQKVARLLTYASTSDNPAATRTVTFTAVPATGNSASTTFNINITTVNDAPVLAASSITLYDTADADTYTNQTGNITPTDPDNNSFTFALTDGVSAGGSVSKAGIYGTFSINETTGAYVYDPNDTAINAITQSVTDVFTITATDAGALSSTNTFTVNILYEAALVTAPPSFSINANVTDFNASGISVSGLQPNVDYSVTLSLINAGAGTTAKIANLGTAERAFGFAAGSESSFTNLTIIGTATEINAALATLKITTGATVGALELRVSATKFISGFASFRGNYYVARTGGAHARISWADANAAAKASTYLGLSGYLVTITSAAEQDFVFKNIANAANVWIGASDAATEGRWEWDPTGGSPEAGKQFWQGVANGSVVTSEGLNYANWCSGEPNNASDEDYAVTNWNLVQNATSSCWNDLSGTNTSSVNGYIIEYGTGSAGVAVARSDIKAITINVSGAPTNTSAAASSISGSTAVLNSSVVANGINTTNRFCISVSSTLSTCATSDNAAVSIITPSTNATTSGYAATSVSANVSSLNFNTTYYFQSYSTNTIGGPIYGTVRSFTTGAPEVPGAPVATPGNGRATVTVTPPASETPTSYLVTSSPGGFTCTVNGAEGSCTVTGLSNGVSYTFTSIAIYSGVNSAVSIASNEVIPRAPIPPRPAQTDVVRPPSIPANPFAPTNRVEGNFTRPITNVTLNGLSIDPTNWRQSPTQFELETRSLRPGRYEVVINNGAATPLTYTFEKPQPTQVVPVILPTPPQPSLTPVVLEGNKEVNVVTTTKTNNAGINVKSDLWELDLSAQSQSQLNPPVVRNNLFTLPRELQIKSAGTGFMPFSLAKIFIFSEPTFVGEVEVKEDGTFETLNDLPEGIELGEHTLQVVGVSPQNTLRSTSLKILVIDAPDQVTIGFNRLQRTVADSYTIPLTSIFDKPVKKIVLEAYAKPTEPKSDRKFAARRAVAATEAIRAIDKSIPIRVKNKGGKISPLCQEFKNRCVVVVVRR
jgi:hypothetical protein